MGSNNGDGQASRGSGSPSASGSLGGGVSVEASSSANGVGGSSLGADSSGLTAEGSSGAVGSGRAIPAPRWLGKRVGRFRLLALLGQGAMGRVFRAEDTLMGRHVALKLLPRTVKKGNTRVGPEMLIREAKAAAAIEHPNAVAVYEVNQAGEVCYVAMELLEGGSLRDLVRAAGPMDLTRACLLCAEAAEALAAAHAAGVVHRDVKPANLMLSRNGRCKVVDFGLARLDEAGRGGEWANGSAAAESVGTPQFIAPEILSGTPASAASDVYSLGGTLFYLLTGRPPFEAPTARELLKMHVSAPVPDLRSFRPDASRGLADAIAKALAKRPAERWASMEQFARVLRVHAIPIAAGAAPADGSGLVGGIPPVADYGSGSGLGSGYAPPPTPGYFPAGPVTDPSMSPNRPARPASPVAEMEAAPPEAESAADEPQTQIEVAYEPEASEPAASEAIEGPVPHGHGHSHGRGLPAWPLLAGGGVLIAAVVAVLCIIFLKAPPKDVASNVTPPTPPPAATNTPARAPAVTAPPATAAPPPVPVQQAEELPPSLVAQWVADHYEAGNKWFDEIRNIPAFPRNAPKVVPDAFNGHAGVQLNGKNQCFVLNASDDPLSGSRMMTVVAVFKPQTYKMKGTRFWEGGGLVGADLKDIVDDWGMGWGGPTGSQVVAGAGKFPIPKDGKPPGDCTIVSGDLELNRAHVAVMTWNYEQKGTATLTLYVDGVHVAEKKGPSEPRLPQIPIALGAADAHGQRPFQGLLAEVRLYNDADLDVRALSDSLRKQYDGDPRPGSPFDLNNLLGQ